MIDPLPIWRTSPLSASVPELTSPLPPLLPKGHPPFPGCRTQSPSFSSAADALQRAPSLVSSRKSNNKFCCVPQLSFKGSGPAQPRSPDGPAIRLGTSLDWSCVPRPRVRAGNFRWSGVVTEFALEHKMQNWSRSAGRKQRRMVQSCGRARRHPPWSCSEPVLYPCADHTARFELGPWGRKTASLARSVGMRGSGEACGVEGVADRVVHERRPPARPPLLAESTGFLWCVSCDQL